MKKVEITAYGAPEVVASCIKALAAWQDRVLQASIDSRYRAQQGGRTGKVLVLPNGAL